MTGFTDAFRALVVATLLAAGLAFTWQSVQARVPPDQTKCDHSAQIDRHLPVHAIGTDEHAIDSEPHADIGKSGCCGLGCSPAATWIGSTPELSASHSDCHNLLRSIALAGFEPPGLRRPPRG
jgi:hypothetical protein